MIIRPMSDLHLEFDRAEHINIPVIDGEGDMVLILAGDITAEYHVWKQRPRKDPYTPWIRSMCERHKAVIYIKGNHEDYLGDMVTTEDYWQSISREIDNLHFLNRQRVDIDGVRFLGCTLWTPLDNPLDEIIAREDVHDFKRIKVAKEKFTVMDWKREHNQGRYFLEQELEKEFDGETVIVTHHAPSFKSIHPRYQGQKHNVCYANALDNLMWYNNIKYWIHGHVHDSMDYIVGDELQSTRVICNPRGYYPEALNRGFDPCLTLDV